MCGIAGALTRRTSALALRSVVALTDGLAHRGPDGEGFWADTAAGKGRISREELPSEGTLVLGHRRLSIVDLVTGDQPMGEGHLWLTYNGEIYNHQELRGELESRGCHFRTTSDTEVLIHGWKVWGEELFPRLNGIFAFAIADARKQEVVLVRDPIGVKPLYVGTHADMTWWASELGAALQAGMASANVLAPDAMKLYLLFRFIPSPFTPFPNVWKLPPGHFARFRTEDGGTQPSIKPYQTSIRSSATPRTSAAWRDAISSELEGAVTRQLMSDVPVGTLLSGGVDSAVVTDLMRKHLSAAPTAFGIGFRSHGEGNEAKAGRLAAQELEVPFVATEIDDADYIAAWPASFGAVGEPIGNSGGLLVQLLCQRVSRTHKVVLSGQGADEPLGGYPRHMAERLWRLGRYAPALSGWASDRVIGSGAGQRLRRVLATSNDVDRYLEIFAVISPERIDLLLPGGARTRDLGRAAIQRWMPEQGDDGLNSLLRVDARLSLADDLLVVADHFAMRSSVELRVPFLDLQFLELVERMPSRFKLSWIGERKWLYRQAAARMLPRSTSQRLCGLRARIGRKMGFTTPAERWLTAVDGPLVNAASWVSPLRKSALLSESAIDAVVATPASGDASKSRELLSLYSLSQWLRARAA